MSNKAEKCELVPKLRFPEFREAEEWQQKLLSVLGQTISGLSGKSGDDFGTGQPFVTYKQVFDCAWIDFSKCERVKIAEDERQNTLQRGDVLFTTSSETPDEVGYASVLFNSPPEPTYLNSFCFSFRPNCLHTLMPEFSRYLFHSQIYRKSINVLAQGSTRFNISKSAFLKLSLPVPQEPEQQKVADCLASLDELITLEAQKLDTLKVHKKGLMQQLFPRDGEALPKLRFPEFREAGEWNYMELDPFLQEYSERVSANTEIPIYSSTRTGLKFQRDYYDNRELENDGEYGLVPEGYFVYRHMSDDGAFKFNINKTGGKIAVSKEYPVFTTVDLHPDFLFYLLNEGEDFKAFAFAQKKGGTRTRLYLKVLRTWKALLPSYPEQQKIANCLSSIDVLIIAQTQKLDTLKAHKKGLMQQLFPTLDEAQG